jgi:hypothetical protein
MPKPKYKISNYLLNGLKWELEKSLNYKINSKLDCKKISNLIQVKTGNTVSESTLYRLFLWKGNQNMPYRHTLEIIAEFLDFFNWSDLEKHLNDLAQFQMLYGILPNEHAYKSLLSINLQQDNLKPIYAFLEQFESDLSLEKKALIGEEIFISLLQNEGDNLNFYKQFHSLSIVREGFFEIFADPDFSIKNYEFGLLYYLERIKPQNLSKDLQDYLFAKSLLLRHYFIRSNKDKVIEIGKQLYLDIQLSEDDLKDIYIYPKIRYFSYRLLYHFTISGFDFNYWEWLRSQSLILTKDCGTLEKRIVIHTLLDTLAINIELQEKTYDEFTIIFPEIFSLLPSYVSKLPLSKRLRYIDANGSSYYKGTNF